MRAPSLLAQCLPALVPHDKVNQASVSVVSERDLHLPSPAVEIIPSKNAHPYKYAGENVDLQGLKLFKGRISVTDMIGVSSFETSSSKPDGSLKCWESSTDLVSILNLEIRDGLLSFRGKRILELGCSYGLAGTFACLKGASTVHFHDLNAETIRCATIPNVLANLEQARDKQSRQYESPLTPSRQQLTSDVHFYSGDWEELHMVLSVVRVEGVDLSQGASLSFSEDDFIEACSSHEENGLSHEACSRQSRKLSGSRAWERGSETDPGDGGYDVILITEIPQSVNSLKKLYALITKCLRPPYGVLYLAVKKNFMGSNGGVRQLRAMVDEEGIFGIHVVTDVVDREIWKFFFK